MNTKLSLLTIVVAALALSACAPKSSEDNDVPQPDIAIPSRPTALQFSSALPSHQSAALNEAISSLYVFPISNSNSESRKLQRLMKMRDVSPAGLQSWMQARVQYVVEETFDISDHVSVGENTFSYQEPTTLPDGFSSMKRFNAEEAHVMMANIGAWIYAKGKKMNVLIGLDIPGIGKISMTSPRTGLLQVGEGLFMSMGSKKTQNIVSDIFRLGILFHEARHSDGHGHTLAFMHATCVDGPYRGKAACDYSTNGPYTVGASVMKALMNECSEDSSCTARSKEVLKQLYADQVSRTLDSSQSPRSLSSNARAGTDWDDAPEGVR